MSPGLHGAYRALPDVPLLVVSKEEQIGHGGYGVVYKGAWTDTKFGNSTAVAIKVIWLPSEDSIGQGKRNFYREIEVWARIRHENILPLLGVTYQFSGSSNIPALVSPMMTKGTLHDYLKSTEKVPAYLFLTHITSGLHFLHTFKPSYIVHGDLKSTNILVDDKDILHLSDFGLSRILLDNSLWHTDSRSHEVPGTPRWKAPELVDESERVVTKQSDIYAFSMVFIEIFTREVPFHTFKDFVVITKVMRGDRPGRPSGMEDWLWELTTRCWAPAASSRPTIEQIADEIFAHSGAGTLPDIDHVPTRHFSGRIPRVRRNTVLPGNLKVEKGELVAVGQAADIYRGIWIDPQSNTNAMAIKVFRPLFRNKSRQARDVAREIEVWMRLKHDNIVPMLGCSYEFNHPDLPSLISQWMPNGTLQDYLRSVRPSRGKVPYDRFMIQIASGLQYLHQFEPSVIHGGLRSASILIDERGRLRLYGFGSSRMMSDSSLWYSGSRPHGAPGVLRWMAPELFDGTQTTVTKQSDIYAFAMIAVEIFTLEVPFARLTSKVALITAIVMKGERPERPYGIEDWRWELITNCWATDPSQRPPIEDVLLKLETSWL